MAKPDENEQPIIDVNVHRRVLGFLNAARSPKDLMTTPLNEILLIDELVMEADEALHHDEHPWSPRRRKTEAAPGGCSPARTRSSQADTPGKRRLQPGTRLSAHQSVAEGSRF